MPGVTPLGIVYPCGGDTIDPGVFKTYADTTQAALLAAQATADDALFPPAAQVRRNNVFQNINAGVSTPITWVFQAFGTDVLYTPGSDTIVTQQFGTYLVSAQIRGQAVSPTSIRVAILFNANEVAAAKSDAGNMIGTINTRVYTSALGVALAPGTAITVNALYTSAASPMAIDGTLSVLRVATV